jgi:hypothetical protein
MTELERNVRAFLRAQPARTFSTKELLIAFPKARLTHLAVTAPDLIAAREPFIATRGPQKGRTCHHYTWQHAELAAGRGPYRRRDVSAVDEDREDGLSTSNFEEITAAIRSELITRLDAGLNDIGARVDRLERIARMIGHDL